MEEWKSELEVALGVQEEQLKDMKMNHAITPQAVNAPSVGSNILRARRLDATTGGIISAQVVLLPTVASDGTTISESASSISSRLSAQLASSSSPLRQSEIGKKVQAYTGQQCVDGTTCNDMNGTPRPGGDSSSGVPVLLIIIIAGGVLLLLLVISVIAYKYFKRVRGEQRASTEAARMEAGPDSSASDFIPSYGQHQTNSMQTEMSISSERSWPPPPPKQQAKGGPPPPPPQRYHA